jgi:hypothetical protein
MRRPPAQVRPAGTPYRVLPARLLGRRFGGSDRAAAPAWRRRPRTAVTRRGRGPNHARRARRARCLRSLLRAPLHPRRESSRSRLPVCARREPGLAVAVGGRGANPAPGPRRRPKAPSSRIHRCRRPESRSSASSSFNTSGSSQNRSSSSRPLIARMVKSFSPGVKGTLPWRRCARSLHGSSIRPPLVSVPPLPPQPI